MPDGFMAALENIKRLFFSKYADCACPRGGIMREACNCETCLLRNKNARVWQLWNVFAMRQYCKRNGVAVFCSQ